MMDEIVFRSTPVADSMKKFNNRFTALLTSVLGGIALLTSVQGAPLPIREDGVYSFKEGDKTVTWRVVPNQLYRLATPTAPEAFVTVAGGTVSALAKSLTSLDASLKRPHNLVIKKDGDSQPHMLSKKVFAVFNGAFNINSIRIHIGAATVVPVAGVTNGYIFTFVGPASALNGAETLLALSSVESAIPLLASQNAKPLVVITDPYFAHRASNAGYCWHLENTGDRLGLFDVDINAQAAWDRGLTGAGLRMSVVDDGLEIGHADLRQNVMPSSGYDFLQRDVDPTAGSHGTAVGGLMAGANNTIGGLGASYKSLLIGLRFLGGPATDEDVGRALNWSPILAVSNNSWGYGPGYYAGPFPLLTAGINEAAIRGRGARGTIMVFAAGNGRAEGQDTNHSILTNNYYVMPVGATNDIGYACSYSTPGAGVMVSGPSGDGPVPNPFFQQITTTDRTGAEGYNPRFGSNYSSTAFTNSFNGTSAASPIVSGAVGLMLQAKSILGFRDVNDIIARTAKLYGDVNDLGWQFKTVDGVTYHFSHDCGAGLMDVDRATAMASTWRNLTTDFAKSYVNASVVALPDGGEATKVFRIPNSPRIRCEKVEVDVTVTHPDGGSLTVALVSAMAPVGTVSLLQSPTAVGRPNTWRYTTTQNWGECSGGDWRVVVSDPADGVGGQLRNVTIKFHGASAVTPRDIPVITDRDMPDGFEHCQRYEGYRIVATNCPLSYGATGLPAGLTCDYFTGAITGTPFESGNFTVVLSARNEAGVGTLTKNLLVFPRIPAPAFRGGFFAVGTVGEPMRLQIQSNDTPKTFTLTADGDPGGTLRYLLATGLIAGVPQNPGIYEIQATVANYCGRATTKIYLWIQPAGRSIANGFDVPGAVFNLDWNDPVLAPTLSSVDTWFWGDDESVFGGDSVVSPIFSYRTTAEMNTIVDGPVRVEFDWKANTHVGDTVEFYTQVAPSPVVRQISGDAGWRHEAVSLGAGTHTLRWVFNNATAAHSETDRARVDHLQLLYPDLDVAVDGGTIGGVNSFGARAWIPTAPTGAQSPALLDLETSSMEVAFNGPGTLKFDWKVSSQLDQDLLSFFLNDSIVSSVGPISGEIGWTTVTLAIPAGTHRARWTYSKDTPNIVPPSSSGSDAGYVDNILFTPAP